MIELYLILMCWLQVSVYTFLVSICIWGTMKNWILLYLYRYVVIYWFQFVPSMRTQVLCIYFMSIYKVWQHALLVCLFILLVLNWCSYWTTLSYFQINSHQELTRSVSSIHIQNVIYINILYIYITYKTNFHSSMMWHVPLRLHTLHTCTWSNLGPLQQLYSLVSPTMQYVCFGNASLNPSKIHDWTNALKS